MRPDILFTFFNRDLDGRQMAVGGFLSILNDQLTEINNGENDGQTAVAESVAFEILGLLRRCFSQQYEIRIYVYNGLGVLSQENPSFAADIFELLYAQVKIKKLKSTFYLRCSDKRIFFLKKKVY